MLLNFFIAPRRAVMLTMGDGNQQSRKTLLVCHRLQPCVLFFSNALPIWLWWRRFSDCGFPHLTCVYVISPFVVEIIIRWIFKNEQDAKSGGCLFWVCNLKLFDATLQKVKISSWNIKQCSSLLGRVRNVYSPYQSSLHNQFSFFSARCWTVNLTKPAVTRRHLRRSNTCQCRRNTASQGMQAIETKTKTLASLNELALASELIF